MTTNKTICPKCSHENPPNQRGCNGCGHIYNPPIKIRLAPKPGTPIVPVLFTDEDVEKAWKKVRGSTPTANLEERY